MPTIKLSENAHSSLMNTAKAIVEFVDAVKAGDTAAQTAARDRIDPQKGLDVLKAAASVVGAVPYQFGAPKGPTGTGNNHGQSGDIQIVYTKDEETAMTSLATTTTATSSFSAPEYNVHIHLHLPKAPV